MIAFERHQLIATGLYLGVIGEIYVFDGQEDALGVAFILAIPLTLIYFYRAASQISGFGLVARMASDHGRARSAAPYAVLGWMLLVVGAVGFTFFF